MVIYAVLELQQLMNITASIKKDRALKRRFQVIKIDEPSMIDVRKMVMCKKKEYEKHPHVTFPDKAIDVLDLSCVKAKLMKIQEVDQECLKMTIESLSQIPFSFSIKIMENLDEFKAIFDDKAFSAVRSRHNKTRSS